MLNNEKITKIIARRYIWLPFLMGVLLGIVCFVVFTGYDRMKIEKIADEMLAILSDRNRIMQKHEMEEINARWNEYLNG